MSENYNKTAERLWEKLEFYRNEFKLDCVDLKKPFPVDQFSTHNPKILELIHEVEDEFNFQMSEFQCSWSVVKLLFANMNEYNTTHNLNLAPRA